MKKKSSGFIKNSINSKHTLILSAIILLFSLLRVPSVVEPYWYGDEAIYEVIGYALRHGRLLYQGIWDNKPPLLYLIYALFSGDQFYVKVLSIIFGIGAVISVYLLAKKLFKNDWAVFTSTGLFAVIFGLPIIEGNIANAENFMLFPIIAAFYFALIAIENKRIFLFILSGILLSLAFLTKIVAIFDLAALIVIVFATRFMGEIALDEKSVHKEIKSAILGLEQEILLFIAFIVPITFTVVYFFAAGALSDFFLAVFSQNVGYVGYGNYFLFPMGALFIKVGLLIFAVLLSYRYRKNIGKTGLVIFIWLAFSIFNAFFSARPYTHYLLVLLPSFSLFAGYIIDQKKLIKLTIPLFIIILFLVHQNFNFYTKLGDYYHNYFMYIDGGSIEHYQRFFDSKTPRDYELASFIKLKENASDTIFLWGDDAQVYILSGKVPPGRYAVSYHITFYKNAITETKAALQKTHPKYIIQTKDSAVADNFLDKYDLKYKIQGANIYEIQP